MRRPFSLRAAKLSLMILTMPLLSLGATDWGVEQKKTIRTLETALQQATKEQSSQLNFQLACVYLQDQDWERSLQFFLNSLVLETSATTPPFQEDETLYQEALPIYLRMTEEGDAQAAVELLEWYSTIADEHEEYDLLNYIVAAAEANLSHFDSFFTRFYKAYQSRPDCYLAQKTQGILCMMLADRAVEHEVMVSWRRRARIHFARGADLFEHDSSLYKFLIFLFREEKDGVEIARVIRQMVDRKVVIPRKDLFPFVREAVDLEEFELAQALIDQAKVHYSFSRVLVTAQNFLNNNRVGQKRL
jgi:hypothetical protein